MLKILGVLLLCQIGLATAHPDPFSNIASSYLVEIDASPIWEKQASHKLPPASLTKLMTALLTIEQTQLDGLITVSRDATRETGSRIGLKKDEVFKVTDLLAATLIASANDACRALADSIAGSQPDFVRMMNRRAQELGMRNTHFSNACGHDADDHFSSARDLSLLAHEVMKHPELTAFTSKIEMRITPQGSTRQYHFENKNELVGRYPGAYGLKTGYTTKAGKCLIATAKRDGHIALLVMLHGEDRWWDAVDILDRAFKHGAP